MPISSPTEGRVATAAWARCSAWKTARRRAGRRRAWPERSGLHRARLHPAGWKRFDKRRRRSGAMLGHGRTAASVFHKGPRQPPAMAEPAVPSKDIAGGFLNAGSGTGRINLRGSLNFNGGVGGSGGGGGNGASTDQMNVSGGNGATGVSAERCHGRYDRIPNHQGARRKAGSRYGANGGGRITDRVHGSGRKGARRQRGAPSRAAGEGAQGGQVLILSTSGRVTVTAGIQLAGGRGGFQASGEGAERGRFRTDGSRRRWRRHRQWRRRRTRRAIRH